MTFDRSGDATTAARLLATAVELDPAHVRARLESGRLLEAQGRLDDAIEQFGLRDEANKRVSTYSGGMKRRLSVAVSAMGDPLVCYLVSSSQLSPFQLSSQLSSSPAASCS